MKSEDILKKRQTKLKNDITAMLDSFIIGTVAKSPSMTGHNLTTKVEGKTVTLYIRKDIAPTASQRSKRYKKMWLMIQALSKVNFELLKVGTK
jgi:hypothetical protein